MASTVQADGGAHRCYQFVPKSILFIGLNLMCNTGIVLINKILFDGVGFRFPMFVTAFHFICTTISMRVMAAYGLFELKQLPLRDVLPLAAAYALSVPLSNLSLAHNSVGMFQTARILGTPYLVALQMYVFKRKFSIGTLASCAIVVTGVLMASVADVHANLWGLVLAGACLVTTAQYQLLVEDKRKELGVTAVQLLAAATPWAAGIAVLAVPLVEPSGLFPPPLLAVSAHRDLTTEGFEGEVLHSGADLKIAASEAEAAAGGEEVEGGLAPADVDAESSGGLGPSLLQFHYTSEVTSLLLLSGAMAVGVNLSVFLLIGATDAVTSTVVGHLKTVAVLVGAFLLFGYPLSAVNIGGIVLAVAGMAAYTYYRQAAAKAAKARLAAKRKGKGKKKGKGKGKKKSAGKQAASAPVGHPAQGGVVAPGGEAGGLASAPMLGGSEVAATSLASQRGGGSAPRGQGQP